MTKSNEPLKFCKISGVMEKVLRPQSVKRQDHGSGLFSGLLIKNIPT